MIIRIAFMKKFQKKIHFTRFGQTLATLFWSLFIFASLVEMATEEVT